MTVDRSHLHLHPPCRVEIKTILSPSSSWYSSCPSNSQSESLTRTRIPGLTELSLRNSSGLSLSRLSLIQNKSSCRVHLSDLVGSVTSYFFFYGQKIFRRSNIENSFTLSNSNSAPPLNSRVTFIIMK